MGLKSQLSKAKDQVKKQLDPDYAFSEGFIKDRIKEEPHIATLLATNNYADKQTVEPEKASQGNNIQTSNQQPVYQSFYGEDQPYGQQQQQQQQGFSGNTQTQQSLSAAGEGSSDKLDIFGIGLDAKRDIGAALGIEGQEFIANALGDINRLMAEGMQAVNMSAADAKRALFEGTLNGTDLIAAGLEKTQGHITDGQIQALDTINQGFAKSAAALGGARSDIFSAKQDAVGGFSPYRDAGQSAIQRLSSGSTPEGFSKNIDALRQSAQPLIDERMDSLRSAQGAVGLSRSGAGLNQMADVSQETLLNLENMLSGRQAGLAQQGLGAQGQIAGLQTGAGQNMAGIQQNIADILAQQGQMGAGIQSGAGQALADFTQQAYGNQAGMQQAFGQGMGDIATGQGENIASLLGSLAQAQMEGATAAAQGRQDGTLAAGNMIGSIMSAFSDRRLKKNIKKVGEINGVNIYSFDANKLGEKVGMNMNIGVIAQEAEDILPHLVGERDGFKTFDYDGFLKEAL